MLTCCDGTTFRVVFRRGPALSVFDAKTCHNCTGTNGTGIVYMPRLLGIAVVCFRGRGMHFKVIAANHIGPLDRLMSGILVCPRR